MFAVSQHRTYYYYQSIIAYLPKFMCKYLKVYVLKDALGVSCLTKLDRGEGNVYQHRNHQLKLNFFYNFFWISPFTTSTLSRNMDK